MPKRIEYLDVAKGIGILLVVVGHNDFELISPVLYRIIYSFHVPLFFFLSGYFINTTLSFSDYFKKRFHSVLKPYFFLIFLIYFVSVSFEKMGFQTAIVRIVKALYGSGYYIDWAQLWFLPNLFVVSLYAFLFIYFVGRLQNRWLTWGVLIATLVVSLLFLRSFYPFSISVFGKEFELFGLPFGLDILFLSGFFFLLGNEVRQSVPAKAYDSVLLCLGTGIGLIVLNVLFPFSVDIAKRMYDSFFVNTAEAILGILFVLSLSRQIELHLQPLASLFKYFGKISLIVLMFHLPIQGFWGQKIMGLTNNFPLSILVGFAMGVLGSALIYEIFIRFNPVASFWFGRKADVLPSPELPARESGVSPSPGTSAVEIKER